MSIVAETEDSIVLILRKTDGRYRIKRRENIEISPIRRSRNQSIGKCIYRYVQRMITSPISDDSESIKAQGEDLFFVPDR